MRGLAAAALACILLGQRVAAAQAVPPAPPPPPPQEKPSPPRPFGEGSSFGGGSVGFTTGSGRTDLSVGASYGYFVLDGLGVGLSMELMWSNVVPTTFELAPFVRLVPFRWYPISPILIARGGRVFIGQGYEDLWFVEFGGGLAYFLSPRTALTIEGIYTRYLSDSPLYDVDDFHMIVGAGLSF